MIRLILILLILIVVALLILRMPMCSPTRHPAPAHVEQLALDSGPRLGRASTHFG